MADEQGCVRIRAKRKESLDLVIKRLLSEIKFKQSTSKEGSVSAVDTRPGAFRLPAGAPWATSKTVLWRLQGKTAGILICEVCKKKGGE